MFAAAHIAKQSDPLGEPEFQTWFFDPESDEIDYQTPDRAWFKSEHTGAGRCSKYYTADTEEGIESYRTD